MSRGALFSLAGPFALAASLALAHAPIVVHAPPGFAVPATGAMESVVYAEVVAQSPNPVDHATVEAQCEAARMAGLTVRRPVFEPGFDRPLNTVTVRFGNARHQADFVTRTVYDCELPSRTSRAADALCACTYRLREQRSVRIETAAPGADPARELARVRALMPEETGRDTVAGIPCVWRRQRFPADLSDSRTIDLTIDRCIVHDEAGVLPGFLRGRALAETMGARTSRATRVVLDAAVDAGVFAAAPRDPGTERRP
jgi:hypothetical protein